MLGSLSKTSNVTTVDVLPDNLSPLEALLYLDEKGPKEAPIGMSDKE